MKYFEYILPFICLGLALIPLAWWRLTVRLRYLQKICKINIMKRQQTLNEPIFFASLVIDDAVRQLYYGGAAKKAALAALAAGRAQKAAAVLAASCPQLALLVAAHADAPRIYRTVKQQRRQWLSHKRYAVFLPVLAQCNYDYAALATQINALAALKLPVIARPYAALAAAYAYLQEADMLSASQSVQKALKAFQKQQYNTEEAWCYVATAEIYRLSCVNDIAATMLESALKIYQKQQNNRAIAETVAAQGMLMLFANRFAEAEECYRKALTLAPTLRLTADINNQIALLQIAQKQYRPAQTAVNKALTLHQRCHNRRGEAFSLQLLGQIAFDEAHYSKAARLSMQAAAIYQRQHNYAAWCESLYTAANAHCHRQQYAAGERLLRQILNICRQHPSSFHAATAYSLLGLIYMQRHEWQRAKVLLQQSLHLEQKNQRCPGLAADYANLALVEAVRGDNESAADNLQIAREYARQTADAELLALIEEKISVQD